MKFVYEHDETMRNLRIWSGDASLVQACFYFWKPGQQMQKSLEGLLQSLLYHILHACPELAPTICPERWNARSLAQPHIIVPSIPWSLAELQRSFALFRTQTHLATKFYFQVDGLDEYYGDSWDVIETMRDLSTSRNVKLCLSSRPWNCFQKCFGQSNPHVLRIHDFTRPDIELFARENLLLSYSLCIDFEPDFFDDLIKDIGRRAKGVFLWVRLVVRSLRDGIMNEDPISLLQARLLAIPSDLEEFFELILGSVEEIYRSRMAGAFLAAMRSPYQLNLIHYYFLEQGERITGFDIPSKRWQDFDIQKRAFHTERWLNGQFKGLLEAASMIDIRAETRVDFLHRTLSDFLATKRMREKLQAWASQELNVFTAISRAMIAESKFIKKRTHPSAYKLAVDLAIKGAIETGNTAHCFKIIEQAELENERMRPSHSKCGLNCYILRYTASLGHVEYLNYRLRRDSATLDLDYILKHAIACPVDAEETDDSCLPSSEAQHRMAAKSQDRLTKSLSGLVGNVPLPSFVKLLFELGADPYAVADRTSSWYALAGETTRLIDGEYKEQYWAVLELFLAQGVDVNMAAEHWIEVLNRKGAGSADGLRNTTRHFAYLFGHGLSPNAIGQGTTITTAVIRMLIRHSDDLSRTSLGLQSQFLREFLRRGANISILYNDKTRTGWLTDLCESLAHPVLKNRLAPRMEQYRILLQHGSDPNELTLDGRTLWEKVLEAVYCGIQQGTCDPAYHQAIHVMFLTSLKYGADPQMDKVQDVLVWMKNNQSMLIGKFDEVQQALQAEIDQRRYRTMQQQSGLVNSDIPISSRYLYPAVGQRIRQIEKRNHEHMSRDGQGMHFKRLRFS